MKFSLWSLLHSPFSSLLLLVLLGMLLIRRSMHLGKTYISSLFSIDKLSFPFISIFSSSVSSQYLLLFLKSSRKCVLLLLSTFSSSSVLQWHHGGNLFSSWLFYVGYYIEVTYSLLLDIKIRLRTFFQLPLACILP